jgi:hypothetical protein
MAFKGPITQQVKFEELFIVDEDRGLALIDDVRVATSITPNINSDQIKSVSVLEENGNFCYEAKFYINTEKCSKSGVTKIAFNVYSAPPARLDERLNRNTSNPAVNNAEVILSKKRPNIALRPDSQQVKVGANSAAAVSLNIVEANKSNTVIAPGILSQASKISPLLGDQVDVAASTVTTSFLISDKSLKAAGVADAKNLLASDVIDLGLLPSKVDKWDTNKDVYSNISKATSESNLSRDLTKAATTSAGGGTNQLNINENVARNNNKKGGTTQTFKVVVDLPKTDAAIAKTNQTKLTIISSATSAISNKTDSSLSATKDKKPAGFDIEDVKVVNNNFLSRGIHPGEAVETFFPNQKKTNASAGMQTQVGSKSNQSNGRNPVNQARDVSVSIGAGSKSATTMMSVFNKTDAYADSADLSKSKGATRKDTVDLLEHVIEEKQLSFEKTTPVVAEFRSKFKEFFKTLNIDIKKSASRQNLFFEVVLLEEGKENFSLRKTFTINHQNQLREFTVPDIKPVLRLASQRKSSLTLLVEQKDPFATSIILEKRIFSKNIRVPDTFQLVKKIDITSRDKPVMVDIPDTCLAPSINIYRAIPVGPLGQHGHVCTNLTVNGLPAPPAIRSGIARNVPTTASPFHAKNTTDGIRLIINSFPDDALSMYIKKTEIGTQFAVDGKSGNIEIDSSGRQVKSLRNQRGPISILDRKVYDERAYKYSCVFKLPFAKRATSDSNEIIKFVRPFRQLPVDVSIKNLVVDENFQNNDVSKSGENASANSDQVAISFLIETTPTETGIEEITQLLVDNNVNDVFIDDLKKDRSRLTSFAFFTVERINLVTGKKDNFGITSSGIFRDDPLTRKKLKITPISQGDRFEYIVKLFLKSPESMFKGATTQIAGDSSTTLKNDQYVTKALAQKFALIYTRAKSLPSEVDLLDKSPGSLSRQILRGETGFSKSVEARTTPNKVNIIKLDSNRTLLGYNEIKWKLSGDITTVDHFIISAITGGKKYPIGVTAPSQKENLFYDKKLCNTIGTVTYTIDLIALDFSKLTSTLSTSMTRQQTLPPALIEELTKDETKMPPSNTIALDLQVGVDVKTRVAVKDVKFDKSIFSRPEIKR